MPSPVTMPPLVFCRNTRPAPPVAITTARAWMAVNSPVDSDSTTAPWTRPSSTSRSTQKYSSKRLIEGNLVEVWNKVWRIWKPERSAANQVRSIFMPPNARTLMWPSALRLQGQPQCSSCTISRVQCSTKYSTTSCSHNQSPPETVSLKWLSRLSWAWTTPAEPPSAATVWLRLAETFETDAV